MVFEFGPRQTWLKFTMWHTCPHDRWLGARWRDHYTHTHICRVQSLPWSPSWRHLYRNHGIEVYTWNIYIYIYWESTLQISIFPAIVDWQQSTHIITCVNTCSIRVYMYTMLRGSKRQQIAELKKKCTCRLL